MNIVKFYINQDVLKIVALVTMTIDHIAKYVFDASMDNMYVGIGRISFPIFAFLLMKHLATKQIYSKYLIRLGIFGALVVGLSLPFRGVVKIANILPFNILISFFVAVLFLYICSLIQKEKGPLWVKISMLILNLLYCAMLSCVCDYGVYGFLFLVLLYFYFIKSCRILLFLVLIFSGLININSMFWFVGVLTTLVLLFNDYDKKSKRLLKKWWWFYVYYPLHLLIIGLVSYLGN